MVGWDFGYRRNNDGAILTPVSTKRAVQKVQSVVARYPRKWYKNGLSLIKLDQFSNAKSRCFNSKTDDLDPIHLQIRRTKSLVETKKYDPKSAILDRRHFLQYFDTDAYLKDFYENVEYPAMQMVLFYLPNVAARLNSVETLLDFGAGPTIHVALCFRNTAEKIYLADYLPQNREELNRWLKHESSFSWDRVLKIIATREGIELSKIATMENQSREKVKAICYCNCLQDPCIVLPENFPDKSFDIITSFFTLEYCCLSLAEYREAVIRLCSNLSKKGSLIVGGILEENWCSFGGRKFTCLYITKKFVLDCLKSAGMDVDIDEENMQGSKSILYEINGMFMIISQKKK